MAEDRFMKLVVPVVVGLLGIVAAVWIIDGAKRRFRDSALESSEEIVQQGIEQAGDEAEEAIKTAGEEGRDIVEDVVKGSGELIDKVADVPGKIVEGISRAGNESPPAEEPDTEVPENKPDPTAEASKDSREPPSVSDTITDLFGAAERIAKTVDDIGQKLLELTVAEQNRIGRQLHELILDEHKPERSPKATERLKKLSQPLVERSARKGEGIKFTFTVLASEEVNAFAHVGGYIYVYKGLLDEAKSDAELECILGHEIGHVELKQCTRGVTYTARAAGLGGKLGGKLGAEFSSTLVGMAYKAISVGYSEDQEFAADKWSYLNLIEMGRSKDDALAGTRLLVILEERSRGQKDKTDPRSDNPGDAVGRGLDNHFRTHPPATERLKRLEDLKLPAAQKDP